MKGRLSAFNTHCPHRVKLVYSIEVNQAREAEDFLHTRYAPHQTNLEWFNLTEEQVEEIPQILNEFPSTEVTEKEKLEQLLIEKDVEFTLSQSSASEEKEEMKLRITQYINDFVSNEEGMNFTIETGCKFLVRATQNNIDICVPEMKYLEVYTTLLASNEPGQLFKINRKEKMNFICNVCQRMGKKKLRFFWEGIYLPSIIDVKDVLMGNFFGSKDDFPSIEDIQEIAEGRIPSLNELSVLPTVLAIDYYELKAMRNMIKT
jgi:hypothetical protein